ncbi:unnamed protein product [Pleuronectes platessa]|uniref:Uncharacterized protein n=1 Tax=Pleuronectes platessa TaxID=8262 RepID=A0A9N7V8X1_PLEPL|nr:unnamed protein product [Pleuronectes platessa]
MCHPSRSLSSAEVLSPVPALILCRFLKVRGNDEKEKKESSPKNSKATDQGVGGGGRRELKSVPFISYLSALQKSQLLSDDMVSGVEIRCEEKGSCPSGCHLCHHQAVMGGVSGRGRGGNNRSGEQPSPVPVLLEVSRVVPLYSLVQDNVTKEIEMTI